MTTTTVADAQKRGAIYRGHGNAWACTTHGTPLESTEAKPHRLVSKCCNLEVATVPPDGGPCTACWMGMCTSCEGGRGQGPCACTRCGGQGV